MMLRLMFLALFVMVLISLGCSKPANYLYVDVPIPFHTNTFRVKDVSTGAHGSGSGDVDVLWLVGGMTEEAGNFSAGMSKWINWFVPNNTNWNMAVIGNSVSPAPYLGMATPFTYQTANPIPTFISAVSTALNGPDDEMIFDPLVANLTRYPNFVNSNSTLLVILSNDAPDFSMQNTSAQAVLQFLVNLKGGNSSLVAVYGVFGADDLGCDYSQIDGGWYYSGSQIEALINATGGKNYSLCDTDFGTSLQAIAGDLGNRFHNHAFFQTLYLGETIDASTVAVYFHNQVMPQGPASAGGQWQFDPQLNAVVFNDMNFATGDVEDVTVTYKR
jgi:hypothetical protein